MRKRIIPLILLSIIVSCEQSSNKFRTLSPYAEIQFGYEGTDIDGFYQVIEFSIQDSIPFNTLGDGLVVIVSEFNLAEEKAPDERNSSMFISSSSDIEYHDNSLENFTVLGSGGGLSSVNGFDVYNFDFDVLIGLDYEGGQQEYDNTLHIDHNGDSIQIKYVSAETGETIKAIKVYRE